MTDEKLRRGRRFPKAGHGALAAVLEPALAEAAGADGRPLVLVSLALEAGAPAAEGDDITVEAWVDRATRTLVFAAAEARRAADQALIVSGSAVFKVVG